MAELSIETAQPVEEGEASPPPARKKRGPLHTLFRWAVRLFVLALLAVGFITARICYTPMSSEWVDVRVKAAVRDATGLALTYSRAEWTIARGHLRVEAPDISAPDTGESLASLSSVEVEASVGSILRAALGRSREIEIENVTASGPVEVFFSERDGKFLLDPKIDRLREIVQGRLEDAATTGSAKAAAAPRSTPPLTVAIGKATLTGVNATLSRVDDDGAVPIAMAQNMRLLAEFNGPGAPRSLLCVGSLQGKGGSSGFRFSLAPSLEREELKIDLAVDEFDSQLHLLAELPQPIRCSRSELAGMLRKTEAGSWTFHSNATIPEFTLVGAGVKGADQTLAGARLFSSIEWSERDKSLSIETAEFDSRDCSVKAKGRLALFGDHAYELAVEPLTLRGPSLALIERSFFKDNYISKPDEAIVEVRGRIAGRLGEPLPDAQSLEYSLRNIDVALPDLPEPITNLRLSGSLTEKRLAVDEGFAVIQGIPISVAASFEGANPLAGKIARARVDWKTVGESAGISDLLAGNGKGPASDFKFKGGVAGAGTLRFKSPKFDDWEQLIKNAEIEGTLDFSDAELAHRDLKKPFRRLVGSVEYRGSQALVKGVSGEFDGIEFRVDGRVDGKHDFWAEPFADLSVRVSGDLSRIAQYCDDFGAKPPEDLPELAGLVTLAGDLKGPLEDWRALELRGRATVERFELAMTPFAPKDLGGTLRSDRFDLDLGPNTIRVAGLSGRWEGVNIRLDGTMTPNDGAFTAGADGPLTEYQKCLVDILERFELNDAIASVKVNARLERKDRDEKPAKTFFDLIPKESKSPEPRAGAEAAEKPPFWKAWELDAQGDISGADLKFTHDSMPAPIEEIYARAKFDMHHLWTPEPIPARIGLHGEGLKASVDVPFPRRGEQFILRGRVTGGYLDLDEFIKSWRKPDPSKMDPPKPPRPDGKPKVSIIAEVETEEFGYKGMRGQNLDGEITYSFYQHGHGELVWNEAKAEAKQGRVVVSGKVELLDSGDIQRYDIKATKMEVADLLQAFFKLDRTGGLASGLATGELHLRRHEPEDKTLVGEGSVKVADSRFVSNAIFGALGRVLRIEELFNDISFPEIEGSFEIANDSVIFRGKNQFALENPSLLHPLSIKVQGAIGPERKLDLDMRLQFLARVKSIPVVGAVWGIVNSLTGQILRYRVVGTLDNPEVTLLP